MKKSAKKIDNAVRVALTNVCEVALVEVSGFQWITHFANYSTFPDSLSVVCVFDTNDDLSSALKARQDDYMRNLIKEKLGAANIYIKDIRRHVSFDTEEACKKDNDGKWHERFS
ncbi:MAG: Fis family transcriptional regulator [Halioglobus sp.]